MGLWGALLLFPLGAHPAAHDPVTTRVTFAREIRAILGARCGMCHAARGSAPMPLTTYEEVRPWARAIKQQIVSRRMPKWHAARGFGAFANDSTLTPHEIALLVSWIDGGLPKGAAAPTPAASAFKRKIDAFRRKPGRVVTVRAGAASGTSRAMTTWVTGWMFEPGDPLISSATIASASGPIATWVAGDPPIALPSGTAIRATGPVRIEVQRRAATDYETAVKARPSTLRLTTRSARPARRAWVEDAQCGAPQPRAGTLLAVRPLLERGANARLWLQRPGAPASVVGWFREFDPSFARAYWLARPADLSIDARLQSDAPCQLQLTLTR